MTPYEMHMLTVQTGKFGDDAASSSCVRVCVRMRPLQESLPQPSLSTWATCLLFPVFFRKVDSTYGGPGGAREAGERMCVFV